MTLRRCKVGMATSVALEGFINKWRRYAYIAEYVYMAIIQGFREAKYLTQTLYNQSRKWRVVESRSVRAIIVRYM